jgi:DNA modification methylase
MRRSVKWLVWLGPPDCYRDQERVLWDVSNCTATLNWEDRFRRRVGGHPSGHEVRWQKMAAASLERGGCTPYNLLPCSAAATSAEHYGHPATTPYAVAEWWVRYILPPGGTLLDPFCGSGTTLAAALDNGASKAIGIDKEAKYLRMAAKRVRAG